MSIKENVESLFGDAYEFLKRSIDGYKLLLVENLSLMLGDMLCGIVVFVLLLVAFFLVMAAMVVLLAPYTGVAMALLIAAFITLLLALLLYAMRVRLFVNSAVKHLCRLLFGVCNDEE